MFTRFIELDVFSCIKATFLANKTAMKYISISGVPGFPSLTTGVSMQIFSDSKVVFVF